MLGGDNAPVDGFHMISCGVFIYIMRSSNLMRCVYAYAYVYISMLHFGGVNINNGMLLTHHRDA